MSFAGKTIVVTGGAMGIGAATARRLAQEGATVIIADRDAAASQATAGSIKDAGGSAWVQPVNLASPTSIEGMGRAIADRCDALHGLVNNAGIVRRAPVAETGDEDWELQMAVNLRAAALCAKALLPLLKRGPGHIVNLSSEGAFRVRPNQWVYDASKAGICALTRSMAAEFTSFGIRANTIAPGWTVTEMHFRDSDDPQEKKKELEQHTNSANLMRRLARPEEIAGAIRFLLDDDASFITATTIHVDGGRIAP
jgi:3-oxoacyl-[acyl-carrier protein] reductase